MAWRLAEAKNRFIAEGPHERSLLSWLQKLEDDFSDRILPVDLETARVWGRLAAAMQKNGRPALDSIIAATAIRHGLPVATRNTADFEPSGVRLLNPWMG